MKFFFLYVLFQVLVGSGDDLYIDFDWCVIVYVIKLIICQYVQQMSLDIKWYIVNFIQEQCIVVSLFKVILMDGIGVGKGFFFMVEQFGFNQVFGDCCYIQCDKWCF